MTAALDEYIGFAHEIADAAGAAIMPHFRADLTVIDKSDSRSFDPVTEADRAAERVMRDAIAARYPDHGVIGEEYGAFDECAEFCWILDPIDGTRAFITGFPLWGVLIGLSRAGKPVLGMMDQPFTQERFHSTSTGSLLRVKGRERPLRTRRCERLAEATLMTTSPDLLAPGLEQDGFAALSAQVKLKRFGGDCYSYCMLAAGHVDLVAEAGLKTFDILPLIPIIERAGGRVSTWDGGDASRGGRILASGDPELHTAALAVLNGEG